MGEELRKLWTTEDYWAVWLGLGIVLMALAVFFCGGTVSGSRNGPGDRFCGCYAAETRLVRPLPPPRRPAT